MRRCIEIDLCTYHEFMDCTSTSSCATMTRLCRYRAVSLMIVRAVLHNSASNAVTNCIYLPNERLRV